MVSNWIVFIVYAFQQLRAGAKLDDMALLNLNGAILGGMFCRAGGQRAGEKCSKPSQLNGGFGGEVVCHGGENDVHHVAHGIIGQVRILLAEFFYELRAGHVLGA